MEGLPRPRSTKDNDSLGGGVHSPFLDSCSARWIPTHPLLWFPQQPSPRRKTCTLPSTVGNACCRSGNSTGGPAKLLRFRRTLRKTDGFLPTAMSHLSPRPNGRC